MLCPRCQHENPTGTKFCGECAAPLASTCPSCGATNAPGNKFCGQCAAPLRTPPTSKFTAPESYIPKHLAEKILTSRAALEGERKQVTVLFADLKGSMELLADRDPEEARKLLDPVLERCGPGFRPRPGEASAASSGVTARSICFVARWSAPGTDTARWWRWSARRAWASRAYSTSSQIGRAHV